MFASRIGGVLFSVARASKKANSLYESTQLNSTRITRSLTHSVSVDQVVGLLTSSLMPVVGVSFSFLLDGVWVMEGRMKGCWYLEGCWYLQVLYET
jgi:hypothetical protein